MTEVEKEQKVTKAAPVAEKPSQLELGKLLCEKGDFQQAWAVLVQVKQTLFQEKKWGNYLEAQSLLLRICAEMERFEEINDIKEELQDLVIRENVELTSKTYYTLALCASYKQQNDVAREYLDKALSLALERDEKENICYAINGLAILYFSEGRYEDALKEIYNLKVFYQVIDIPDLKISSLILNGHILKSMGEYDKAIELYWQCYDKLKEEKKLYMYIHVLNALGYTYSKIGDHNLARVYLTLAKRAIDPDNHVALAKIIQANLDALGGAKDSERYDIVFHMSSNSVVEKKRGRVDFKNQFIFDGYASFIFEEPWGGLFERGAGEEGLEARIRSKYS
jgi:tetratricopeptide (TPR) repeat protein